MNKIRAHLRRFSFHLGKKINTGSQKFKMRGYYASRLDWDDKHEPYMLKIIRKQIENNDGTFLDIGVNVGQTLLKVLEINRDQRYLGIEPLIGCCFHVQEFLRLNNLHNASIIPIALSDKNGTMKLFFRHQFDDMASFDDSNEGRRAKGVDTMFTYVQTRIGDELIKELNIDQISTIKIDVEGAEIRVLRGLKDTLKAMKPTIIFEVLPNYYWIGEYISLSSEAAKNNQANADAIYAFLTDLGYDIFLLDHSGNEIKINKFILDNKSSIIGTNYIAY
ncbi:MAG: FkbM family methyltransferase [Kordiimonadaceae bacterium]|nr:FkbM family methyltransferase [Kordiimonadaceae bacterium]